MFAGPAAASAIATGFRHTCAVTNAGVVLCWGENNFGQLGDGGTTDQSTPVAVNGLSSAVSAIDGGTYHTCALTNAGAALCWGSDWAGQLGDGGTSSWDAESTTPVVVSALSSGASAIAAGGSHTCALTNAGAALCWGSDQAGQLGDGGTNTAKSAPVAVSGLSSGIRAIAAGESHTCALTGAGAVRCWGSDRSGQLGDGGDIDYHQTKPTPVAVIGLSSGITAIAAGGSHTCALTNAGAVLCWGDDGAGQLGNAGTDTPRSTPVAVSGLSSGVRAISAGGWHTCALTNAGAALCWGFDNHGQLGDGSNTYSSSTPVAVSGLSSDVSAIAGGEEHTCALTGAGAVLCWGSDRYGELGNDGDHTNQFTPVSVIGFPTPSGLWLAPMGSLRCGTPTTLIGGSFTAGSVILAFIATPSGIRDFGPYTPTTRTASSLTWTLPCSVGLGNGFIALQVINTDQNYIASNTVAALLLAATTSGYPSITGVDDVAVTEAHPSYPLAHVRALIGQGSVVTISGTGFAVPAKVNLFTAAGNAGPLDTLEGSTSTALVVQIPFDAPTGPGALQVVNPSGIWPISNAVSVPLGATISVTSITPSGNTITVDGTGFSALSVINFFTAGGTNHCGLSSGGTALCPITLVSDTRFTVQRPASTADYAGPAFIEVLNPPFIPFSSTGTDPDGAFDLISP